MSRQIIVGFAQEGSTDIRLLESIIQRTFEAIAFECDGDIEVLPIRTFTKIRDISFSDEVLSYARKAEDYGVMVLCVHVDADDIDDGNVFLHKIGPAFALVRGSQDCVCKNLLAIVPVRMSEAWMLADKDLLKTEIGTSRSDYDLNIHRAPESFADPKAVIEEAIRLARAGFTARRRRQLNISDLYQVIGQKIRLEMLRQLSAYQKFEAAVREAYRNLNYLR
jgi:hypothetical protein